MDKELIHKNKSTKIKTNINIKTVENKDIQTDIENSSVVE